MAEEGKRYAEYDARQEFVKDTNERFSECCEWHKTSNHERLFRAANTLYISVHAYFDEEDRKDFKKQREKYYALQEDIKRVKALGQHKSKTGYVHIYLPLETDLRKQADEFFEALAKAISINGILLPTSADRSETFDLETVFKQGSM